MFFQLSPLSKYLNHRQCFDEKHRIHQKQVLALFGAVLPFALVDKMDYWAIPVVSLVMFTLYGIDGIGSQLEDPFGYDRNDIKMDFIVEDIRSEITVLLEEWKRAGDTGGEMFVGKKQDNMVGQGPEVTYYDCAR